MSDKYTSQLTEVTSAGDNDWIPIQPSTLSNGLRKIKKSNLIVEQVTNRAFSNTILVDKDYASMGDNTLTQPGGLSITLDTTDAINGKYNANEIVSDGNTWTITPTSDIAVIQNNATGVSILNNVITPTNGNRYLLTFWYVNSKWNIIINDWTAYVADATAPTIGTFAIEDANPDRITFVSSEVITGTTFGGFTISTGQTITGININAGSTTGHYFTVDTAFTEADGTPTIAYSGTGCNIQDEDSNVLESFTATNITNNVVDPPAFVSAEIGNVADDILVVVYDKAVNATTAGHNIDTDGAALSISSISSGSGTTTINFQLSRSVLDSETLNYDYSRSTGATVAVTGGKELSEITDEVVTNNISSLINTNSLVVDQTGEGVEITDNLYYFNTAGQDNPFTILAWIKFTNLTGDKAFMWINDDTFALIVLDISTTAKLRLKLYSGSGTNRIGIQSTTSVSLNTWYYVAMTYDGSETEAGLKMYINNVEESTTSQSAGTYNGFHTRNGNVIFQIPFNGATFFGNSKINVLRVFNKELSSVEISSNASGNVPVNIPGSLSTNIVSEHLFNNNALAETGTNGVEIGSPTYDTDIPT